MNVRAPQSGLTIIELMTALAVLGVLMMVALPNMTSFISSNRLSGQTNELVGDLSYARSEASARQQQVAVCMSSDQSTCTTSGSWAQGRIIFVDTDADGTRTTATDPLLRASQPLSGSTAVTASGFGSTAVIRYRPFGGVTPATSGTLKLCPSSGAEGRLITVSTTGRPNVTKTACP